MSDPNIIKINYQSFVDKEMPDFQITENLNITEKAAAVLEYIVSLSNLSQHNSKRIRFLFENTYQSMVNFRMIKVKKNTNTISSIWPVTFFKQL